MHVAYEGGVSSAASVDPSPTHFGGDDAGLPQCGLSPFGRGVYKIPLTRGGGFRGRSIPPRPSPNAFGEGDGRGQAFFLAALVALAFAGAPRCFLGLQDRAKMRLLPDEMDALPEGMVYLRCIVQFPFRVFLVLRPMQGVFQNVLPDGFVGIIVADDVFPVIPLPDTSAG